jgi:hypothetical protein
VPIFMQRSVCYMTFYIISLVFVNAHVTASYVAVVTPQYCTRPVVAAVLKIPMKTLQRQIDC